MQTALSRSMVLAAALVLLPALASTPAPAQDSAPKRQPTAAEKLGGEPVATKEEAELRSRQQQELDAALKKDVYINTPIPAKATQPAKPEPAKDGTKGKQAQENPPKKSTPN